MPKADVSSLNGVINHESPPVCVILEGQKVEREGLRDPPCGLYAELLQGLHETPVNI